MPRAVQRAMQVLECLGQTQDGLNHSRITRALNIPKSSVTAILSDLVALDFILFDPLSKTYSLGPRIISLAHNYLEGLDLIKIGAPIVKALARLTGESVAIYIQSVAECQLIFKEDSSQPVLRMLKVGARAPMYAIAAGKVLLAYRDDHEIAAYLKNTELKRLTPDTITEPETLFKELHKIRAGSLAYNREEFEAGVLAVSAPVFERHGEVVAALTVVAPSFRVDEKRKQAIEEALRSKSVEFSHFLGFEKNMGTS